MRLLPLDAKRTTTKGTMAIGPRHALFAIALSSCSRPSAPAPAPEPAPTPALPDTANGFTAGPITHGDTFERRTYVRGPTHVEVTIAHSSAAVVDLAQWKKMSADYPPAPLGIADADGSGFYDCQGSGADERCDLHAQLRSGVHVEMNAAGSATRADLDALVAGLPLAKLAASK